MYYESLFWGLNPACRIKLLWQKSGTKERRGEYSYRYVSLHKIHFCYFVGYLFVAHVGFAIVYKEGDLDMFLGGKTPTMEEVKLYCWGNIFTVLQCGASARKNASAEKAFKQSLGEGELFSLLCLHLTSVCWEQRSQHPPDQWKFTRGMNCKRSLLTFLSSSLVTASNTTLWCANTRNFSFPLSKRSRMYSLHLTMTIQETNYGTVLEKLFTEEWLQH